jgi:hypothetical protein
MAKKDVERLIGRAVLDPVFRESLLKDPEKTIRIAGLNLSQKEIERLKEIDPQKAQAAIEEMVAVAGHAWK